MSQNNQADTHFMREMQAAVAAFAADRPAREAALLATDLLLLSLQLIATHPNTDKRSARIARNALERHARNDKSLAARPRHLTHEEQDVMRRAIMDSAEVVHPGILVDEVCDCEACRPITLSDMRFNACPICGNKHCPHARDHRNACTGSNELGQIGSAETVKGGA